MTVIRFLVNAEPVEVDVRGSRRLLDVLREDLALTGTKEGCGEGECGACSVLVDGEVVDACLIAVAQVDGRVIRTVEGLGGRPADGSPRLDDLQQAFLETGGAQCGICTPGMITTAQAWLDECAREGRAAGLETAREALAGNLCRCTGYTRIVSAIAAVAGDGAPTTRAT